MKEFNSVYEELAALNESQMSTGEYTLRLAYEIGITNLKELDEFKTRYKKEHPGCIDDITTMLIDYKKELGPDFKINSMADEPINEDYTDYDARESFAKKLTDACKDRALRISYDNGINDCTVTINLPNDEWIDVEIKADGQLINREKFSSVEFDKKAWKDTSDFLMSLDKYLTDRSWVLKEGFIKDLFKKNPKKTLAEIQKEIMDLLKDPEYNKVMNDAVKGFANSVQAATTVARESLTEEAEKEPEIPESFEDKMDFLAADEQEAIDGYDLIIAALSDEDANVKEQLE